MSFPTNGKVFLLHSGQLQNDLLGIKSLRPHPVESRPLRDENVHHHGKTLAQPREVSPAVLVVSTQVDAHHFAIGMIFHEPADTVRKPLRIDTARSRSPAFGKNHQTVFPFQKQIAFLQGRLHLVAVAPAMDRNAFGEIAQDGYDDALLLEIHALRQVPGYIAESEKMIRKRKHPVSQDNGIDQCQVIGTDQPGTGVFPEFIKTCFPDPVDIADPVSRHPQH
jgi:hypothetical protein